MPRTHEPGESPPTAAHDRLLETGREPEGPIPRPPVESPQATHAGLADDPTRIKPSGGRPWSALTTTTSGLLTLQELMEDHPDDTDCGDLPGEIHVIQADGKSDRLTRGFVHGDRQTYRITMNYGLTVESTANHPWFVSSSHRPGQRPDRAFVPINQWKATEAIVPGQVIEGSPHETDCKAR
jgi:hypothetical protein